MPGIGVTVRTVGVGVTLGVGITVAVGVTAGALCGVAVSVVVGTVGVTVLVGVLTGVPATVGVGVRPSAANSIAPMSHPLPCGRTWCSWSSLGQDLDTASIAGLLAARR